MRIGTALDFLRLGAYLQFLAPRPPRDNSIALADRLANFPRHGSPLERPVEVRWDGHQIPFIQATTDHDLAVSLGLVHAHLRLGQMEIMRRIAYGRVSEMIGPVGLDIDHTLRIIDFPYAVPDMLRRLPARTHDWLSGFVTGINHALMSRGTALPHEFHLFGLKREPWSVSDVLAVGRLVGWDFMWLVWLRLLKAREAPEWPHLWRRLVNADAAPMPEPVGRGMLAAAALAGMLSVNNRHGSNSLAVSRGRDGQPATWIASDPHLDLSLPSNWLIAGYRSPSYHAVGLMIPGLPFVALGRNPWIAWGGTALHAITSDLVDISHVPESAIARRTQMITPRWSHPRAVTARWSPLGPVLSDSVFYRAAGDRVALRWVGHQPSDEISAMLAVNRARNWDEFRAALDGFAIPAQNLVFADRDGNVGHAGAAWVPKDVPPAPKDLVTHADEHPWVDFLTAADLPARFNPPSGFVVSANDRPVDTDLVIGRFFASRDRLERLSTLLDQASQIDFAQLAGIQQDVEVASARRLAHVLAEMARAAAPARLGDDRERVVQALASWDGIYASASEGAAAFEVVLYHFARLFYPPRVFAAYAAVWALRNLIRADVEAADPRQVGPVVRNALGRAARAVQGRTWGDLHRLRVRHPLGAVPVAGRRYRYFDFATSGGSESVMKTANGLAGGRHAVHYGSNARHISELADPDGNYFVLFGGQDGWFGSTTFADQIPLWKKGEYVQVPLRPETIRKTFPFAMTLRPGGTPDGAG